MGGRVSGNYRVGGWLCVCGCGWRRSRGIREERMEKEKEEEEEEGGKEKKRNKKGGGEGGG